LEKCWFAVQQQFDLEAPCAFVDHSILPAPPSIMFSSLDELKQAAHGSVRVPDIQELENVDAVIAPDIVVYSAFGHRALNIKALKAVQRALGVPVLKVYLATPSGLFGILNAPLPYSFHDDEVECPHILKDANVNHTRSRVHNCMSCAVEDPTVHQFTVLLAPVSDEEVAEFPCSECWTSCCTVMKRP